MRQPIGKRLRFEIFKRDGFACQYCGATPPGALLEVDHIHPVAAGGGNEADNLVTACFNCNRGKSARLLSAVPKSLSDKAEETNEREAQIAGYAAVMDAARDRLEDDAWRVVEILEPGATEYSVSRLIGIKRFVRDLGVHEVLDAADITTARKGYASAAFKYFCGVCWNKIRAKGEQV